MLIQGSLVKRVSELESCSGRETIYYSELLLQEKEHFFGSFTDRSTESKNSFWAKKSDGKRQEELQQVERNQHSSNFVP